MAAVMCCRVTANHGEALRTLYLNVRKNENKEVVWGKNLWPLIGTCFNRAFMPVLSTSNMCLHPFQSSRLLKHVPKVKLVNNPLVSSGTNHVLKTKHV